MKKLLIISCLLGVMTAITACGTDAGKSNTESAVQNSAQIESPTHEQSNEQTSGEEEEQRIFEIPFGEPFYYELETINRGTSQVMITLSDPEIVDERSGEGVLKADTDYIKVFVQVENVGDNNSYDRVITFDSFKTYNSNGVDITATIGFTMWDERYVEGEYEEVALRPNGKNEGYLYIPFKAGEVPTEFIMYENTHDMFIQYSKQYIFKL